MSKVILLKGNSQYNVVNFFVDNLADCFGDMGYTTVIINLLQKNIKEKFDDEVIKEKDNIKFLFSFNGIGLPYIGQLSSEYHIPFITFYLDSPIYHFVNLSKKYDYMKIIYMDKNDVSFLRETFFQQAEFIPHGALTKHPVKYNKKERDLIFAGSINQPEPFRRKWLSFGNLIGKFYDDLLEFALSKEIFNVKEDIDYLLKLKKMDIDEEQKKLIYFNSVFVHQYIRNYRRIKLLETLKDFPVHIYGQGWNNVKIPRKHIIHKPQEFRKILQEIQKTKILINTIPEFVYGGHERIFTAMYHGTAVVTNSNPYMEQMFQNEKDIVLFSWSALKELPLRIEQLLKDGDKLTSIIVSGQQLVRKSHTWFNRAQDIIKLVK